MSTLSVLDRLRIERVVWSLDQRLYDLPRATRTAHRRELRANLAAAAHDVGTTAALHELGDATALAAAYHDAAFGTGPRPSWLSAAVFLLTATLVLPSILFEAAQAFGDGIIAGDPAATGTFRWPGIAFLQSEVTYTVSNGAHDFVGGAYTPLTYLLLLLGTIWIGRLWRAVPAKRRAAELDRAA